MEREIDAYAYTKVPAPPSLSRETSRPPPSLLPRPVRRMCNCVQNSNEIQLPHRFIVLFPLYRSFHRPRGLCILSAQFYTHARASIHVFNITYTQVYICTFIHPHIYIYTSLPLYIYTRSGPSGTPPPEPPLTK